MGRGVGLASSTGAAVGDERVGRGVGLASSAGATVGDETDGAGVCPHATTASIIITASRGHILYIIDSFLSPVSDIGNGAVCPW